MYHNSNTTKEVKQNFIAGYDNLPAIQQMPVKTDIMRDCGWRSIVTFHNKRRGIVPIKPVEISIIEAHFRKVGINPWTGLQFFDENF